MSGPGYPLAPVAGSNAIGSFEIGVSQIGDISTFNPWNVIISQYANSPILDGLILSFASAVDMTANFDAFFDAVVNPDTAFGFGLDIWGRIVGIGRVVQIATSHTVSFFGFSEAGTALGFGQGQFYSGSRGSVITYESYQLTDTLYRNLIFAKALANISNSSIPAINRILLTLFPGRGNCWVSEGSSALAYFGFSEAKAAGFGQAPFWSGGSFSQLSAVYNFTFVLSGIDLAMINSGVLPTPTGVRAIIAAPH